MVARSMVWAVVMMGWLSFGAGLARAESIDGRVTVVDFPFEDINLLYVESRGEFTVEMRTPHVWVSGTNFWVGDGKVAVKLESSTSKGIVFQNSIKLENGYVFKKGEKIEVLPGYELAKDLKPGDVYLKFPNVFVLPPEKNPK
jgi:hypothetical protein